MGRAKRTLSCTMQVGLLLETYGYRADTRIYLAGTENTGGQRLLLYLKSTFENLEDRLTLSTVEERSKILETPSKKSKKSILGTNLVSTF